MEFEYYHNNDGDQFRYIQLPTILLEHEYFSGLSLEAIVLYSMMLNRISLSFRNGWIDEHSRVYIYFTLEEVMKKLRCKSQKATKIIAELDVDKGIGLIERKRQGLGKPTIIYVKNFMSIFKNQDYGKTEVQTSENQNSGTLKNRSPDYGKSKSNYIDISEPDLSKNDMRSDASLFGLFENVILTQEDLKKIIDSNTNLKFHIHVNETNEQAAEHFEKHQTTVIEFLDELGLFNHKVILAHNLGASDKELEMLHDKSILIPHCPETYLKLAMPIENMAKHEALNTTFGTDGVVSNDTMSILNQAKLFGLFGKWQQQDCTQYDALYLWKKLFNGHKFFDFNTGDIQEGKRADFIVWDLNQPNTFSYPNLISSIIYASNQQQIVEVYSTGIEIKKGIESLSIEKEYVHSRLNSFKEVKSELTF